MADVNVEEIKADVGLLFVHYGDTVSSREKEVGAQLGAFLHPGMTVVGVGGKIGYIALLMAEQVGASGRVVAIEEDSRNVQILRLNAARTRGARIEVVEAPLGPGTVRLDDVLPARVDLMLIGAQATGHVALRGARRLIERSRPMLFVEFWPQGLREAGVDPVSVLDGYRAMGLRAIGAEGELPVDPGELVRAVDGAEVPFTTLRLEPVDSPRSVRERLLLPALRLGRTWERRFPPTVEPGTLAYDATHRALVGALLDDDEWRGRFESGGQLPRGLGAGFDERVVEYPWLFSRGLHGRVLDAGSVLNHRHLIEPLLPSIADLTIVTLAPEPLAFNSLGVSYLYGDLRELPLRDDWYDEVVCLSTIEHVGMDNSVYGAAALRAEDPRAEAARALRELLRVVRPGGRVHLSLPFGLRQDHDWFRQLDREDVDDLLTRAGVARHEETIFLHTPRGWRRGTAQKAAAVGYNSEPGRADDRAVAARAVLCMTITA